MVLERRDFSVATYSVVCSTGFAASVTISTGIGGGAPPGPPGPCCPPPRPQAAPIEARRNQRIKGEHLEYGFGKAGGGHSGTHGLSANLEDVEKANPYYTMMLQKLANRGASTKAQTIG
jgi:hypothetical protein